MIGVALKMTDTVAVGENRVIASVLVESLGNGFRYSKWWFFWENSWPKDYGRTTNQSFQIYPRYSHLL